MQNSEGNYYSSFVRGHVNDKKLHSIDDKPFDAGYLVISGILVILGATGWFLNGRSLYVFCKAKTVRIKLYIKRV